MHKPRTRCDIGVQKRTTGDLWTFRENDPKYVTSGCLLPWVQMCHPSGDGSCLTGRCSGEWVKSVNYGAAAEPPREHPAHRGAKSVLSTRIAVEVLRIAPEKSGNRRVFSKLARKSGQIGRCSARCISRGPDATSECRFGSSKIPLRGGAWRPLDYHLAHLGWWGLGLYCMGYMFAEISRIHKEFSIRVPKIRARSEFGFQVHKPRTRCNIGVQIMLLQTRA